MSKRFNKKSVLVLLGVALIGALSGLFIFINSEFKNENEALTERFEFEEEESFEQKEQTQKARREYFNSILKDPKTNEIPKGIRSKELQFAEKIKMANKAKALSSANFTWSEIGPYDVSGRTRGMAMDRRNSDIIIAGGASGGIWKTTNGGLSWEPKTQPGQNLGVSAVIQHPTNNDTWYYSTAEFFGSAGARDNGDAAFYGSGIYKSTDNGETWFQLPGTVDNDNGFSTQFDFISNIVVSPTTGTMFFSSNAFGVFRTTNDGLSTSLVLGRANNHIYADVAVTDNGTLYAVVSSAFGGVAQVNDPGVYMSTNDGLSWTDITPSNFPSTHYRSVLGVAPSDQDVFYVFTDTGTGASGLRLFKFDVSNAPSVASEDRTNGIPDFGGDVGDLNPQGGYNLICKVLPNDANTVFLGGTNLFRSKNGFNSTPVDNNGDGFTDDSQVNGYWIGGYASVNNVSQYENHHPDQHNLIFDPNDPKKAYSAHDGGISFTNDITAEPVDWVTREEGYNVTQFYTISIHPDAGDPRIAGGTQDNGTPYFLYDLNGNHDPSSDQSSGDGSFTFVGKDYLMTSAQNGFMLKQSYNLNKRDLFNWSYVAPLNATNQLFIHPFAVNPQNNDVVIYPERHYIWRNDDMNGIARNTSDSDGTIEGWEKVTTVSVGSGHTMTALAFSNTNPSNRLYMGGYASDRKPTVYRLDNAGTATNGEVNISIAAADTGAYIHDISVNPEDGNEVIVVMSNYDVKSVFHSSNAGQSWSEIGGNLEGVNGPSVRTAAIAPTSNGTYYFVGTSTGLYYTDQLNGNTTTWIQESDDLIGRAVIADMDYRNSDNVLAVGTHGRGMFLGQIGSSVANEPDEISELASTFELNQNYPNPFNPSTNISFTIPQNSRVTLTVYNMAGQKVATLIDNNLMTSGNHSQTFDASSLASGTYLYKLDAIPASGGTPRTFSKTMTLIK